MKIICSEREPSWVFNKLKIDGESCYIGDEKVKAQIVKKNNRPVQSSCEICDVPLLKVEIVNENQY